MGMERESAAQPASERRLLTAAEEIRLAEVWRAGRERIGKAAAHTYRYVTPEAIAARETMVRHNQRLVESIAARYARHGTAWDDLVQEGNVGLLRAIDRFDPRRGNRFSTLATWWIRKAISQLVKEDTLIRSAARSRTRIPVASLDGEAAEFYRDTVEDPAAHIERGLTAAEDAREDAETLRQTMLAHLSPLQCYVLAARYGFDGHERTHEEIADETARLRARGGVALGAADVRAIERAALEHLRCVLGAPKIVGLFAQERLAWPA